MADFTSPAVQAMNLIRYIGDEVVKSGEPIPQFPGNIHEFIHAPTSAFARELIEELQNSHMINVSKVALVIKETERHLAVDEHIFRGVNLTLQGWEKYEDEKRGQVLGNYGFIAMKFNERELDAFVEEVVKPAVKEHLGYDLVDMCNAPETGIIDNIMRVRIRDAKFVIVDLTHDNNGAYWEAGYAEGLGKPVLYICEKEKFDERKTHFDTNHCTTIPWSRDEDESFRQRLIATLRCSLEQSS